MASPALWLATALLSVEEQKIGVDFSTASTSSPGLFLQKLGARFWLRLALALWTQNNFANVYPSRLDSRNAPRERGALLDTGPSGCEED